MSKNKNNKNFEEHQNLVKIVIKRLARFHDQDFLQDLEQEANMALLQACRQFDPTRGYEFSTYAMTAIYNAVNTYSRKNSNIVAVNYTKKEIVSNYFQLLSLCYSNPTHGQCRTFAEQNNIDEKLVISFVQAHKCADVDKQAVQNLEEKIEVFDLIEKADLTEQQRYAIIIYYYYPEIYDTLSANKQNLLRFHKRSAEKVIKKLVTK